ncbi:MGMT family protein [Edwardsiella piscicida]|nr:MGMT family protein [Edwardsiella piscicida]EKS7778774.1 MGMT family protein [Edwardsiella piscicida]EKS7782194.1 MGMT family protein [Edwardsiella piscicida]EKS7792100.1 MGMT family protein [Edwardsiella piscicida]ELM3656913.1 MGMT family protein [Edwardsiella piscicida]
MPSDSDNRAMTMTTSPPAQDDFRQRVLLCIAAIPVGRVATYGQIAAMAGHSRAARRVGAILRALPAGSALPWHRVVNRLGTLSLVGEGFTRQRSALQAEGIDVNADGRLDLARLRWQP